MLLRKHLRLNAPSPRRQHNYHVIKKRYVIDCILPFLMLCQACLEHLSRYLAYDLNFRCRIEPKEILAD
jgi:hypothetical protein